MKSEIIRVSDELELYVEESGRGELPVVFVPGWSMSTRVFERQLNFFEASKDFRFITFDPRAHGKSSKTDGGHHYEQHGRDLHALIEKLNLNEFVLAGWSFGTLAALSYVNQFGSDRLCGLIMLDGPAKAMGTDETTEWFTYSNDDADGMREFFTMGRLRDRDNTLDQFASYLLENPSTDEISMVSDIARQTPDTVAALLSATSIYCDYQADLVALADAMPLLYVLREGRGRAVRAWASRYTPQATVAAFGGHMMFWDRADDFNAVLVQYLNDIVGRR